MNLFRLLKMYYVDEKDAPNRPSGWRRLCAVNSQPRSGGELRRLGFAKPSIKIPKGEGGQQPPEPKRKDTQRVSFLLVEISGIEPLTS